MRRTLTLIASVLLIVSVLSVAAPAVANHEGGGSGYDDSEVAHNNQEEHNPDCRGDDNERQDGSFGLDPVNAAPGVFVPMDFGFDHDGDGDIDEEDEQFITICSGEHWDGQDPNTQDSSEDTRANEGGDGNIYVNPEGDCSGYDSGHHNDGCPNGEDRPTFGEVLHLRVTGDVPTANDPAPDATLFIHEEIWGVGQGGIAVHFSEADEGGYLSIYLEDHAEQIFHDTIGGPAGGTHPLDPVNDINGDGKKDFGGHGNYLTIPFDPVQQGTGDEGDCTSETYQSDDDKCNRDNSALATLQIGYGWVGPVLGFEDAAATGPNPLP